MRAAAVRMVEMVVGFFEDERVTAVEDAEAARIAEVLSPLAVELELGAELELAYLLERIAALIAAPVE
jgi:hypothetical protein